MPCFLQIFLQNTAGLAIIATKAERNIFDMSKFEEKIKSIWPIKTNPPITSGDLF
jgi:hypothetical protein